MWVKCEETAGFSTFRSYSGGKTQNETKNISNRLLTFSKASKNESK